MSSLRIVQTNLEDLPDEILLFICRYLSSVDVLYSFYGLNTRLSQTISDYCQHIVLSQVPFKRFNSICTSILPDIGANIHSLTISNEWTGVLSKVFLSHYAERISLTFPSLKRLTLVAFISKSLSLLIDCLQNLPELSEMTIDGLFAEFKDANEAETLLYQIFLANNSRLKSILFGNYSVAFNVNTNNNELCFSNIEKLHIELKTVDDLHRLLSVTPQLRSLHVKIHEGSVGFSEKHPDMLIPTLKSFHLQSFRRSWHLLELTSVLKRMPNIEELSIEIDSYSDMTLLDGDQMFAQLSILPLKQFNYFLRLSDASLVDETKILSTWQQFNQELISYKNENDHSLILYSLPFRFDNLILPCSLAKTKIFSDHYASQMRLQHLYEVTKHVSETFSTLAKCHRLHRLCLQINERIISQSCPQTQQWKLPFLTTLSLVSSSLIDIDDFRTLFERSPNLSNLNIDDKLFHLLLNDTFVCQLLNHHITHLCITICSKETFQSITSSVSQLPSICSSLKYFYCWIEDVCQASESLIITVFEHLFMWKYLVSFVTVGIILKPEILEKGIRQWTLENSSLCDKDLFIVDYFEERFRLWL